jgi:hypothetical protein
MRELVKKLTDIETRVKPKASACSPSENRAVIVSMTSHLLYTWDSGKTWHLLQTPEIPPGTGWPRVQWLEEHPKGGSRILATHIHGALWESSPIPATGPATLTWEPVLNQVPRAFYAGSAASTNGTILLAIRQTAANRFIENFEPQSRKPRARGKMCQRQACLESSRGRARHQREGSRRGGGGSTKGSRASVLYV